MLESRGTQKSDLPQIHIDVKKNSAWSSRLLTVVRKADKPIVDTAIWLGGVIGGALLPVLPAFAVPIVGIAGLAYYFMRLRIYKSRPARRHYIETIQALVFSVSARLPRCVSALSVWIPNGEHLILAAHSLRQIPADGRTRITAADNCAIWRAYETGRNTAEEPTNRPEECTWIRREALPIPDIEDRISVAGIISFEVTRELTANEHSRILDAMASARPSLSTWLSLLVVAPHE